MAETRKPKPKTPTVPVADTLSPEEAAALAGVNWAFVQSNGEIEDLFTKASTEGWFENGATGKALFDNALKNTTWYRENSTFARNFLESQAAGGAAFTEQVNTARSQVKQAAVAAGAMLDEGTLSSLTEQYLMGGWFEPNRQQFLTEKLAGYLDYSKGAAGKFVEQLRATAAKNGVTYSDEYYNSAVRRVATGEAVIGDYLTEIRRHAASAFPIFGERILSGEDASDIASPYLQKMQDVLEIPAEQISLSDPYIQQALGGVDDKGKPAAMGLWDFQKALKKDPRWQYTKQASDQVGQLTQSVLAMFGYGGSQ